MKKTVCVLLALLMLTGAACAEAPGAALGFEILRIMSDGTENAVVSPVSLACALAMAAEGAAGETETALLSALGADTASQVTETALPEGLKSANAVFAAPEMRMEPEYVDALTGLYGAERFTVGKNLAAKVNAWVVKQTDGMIEKLLDEAGPEVKLALVNAVAMDAEWQVPFLSENTWTETFHAPDGDVDAEMMHRTLWTEYGERDGVQLLRLGYADCGMSMLIALPEAGGVGAVLDGLCAEGLGYFTLGEEAVKVELTMPKTDLSTGGSLREALEVLGLGIAFSDAADFSGISGEMPVRIDDIIQKTRLILDEEGTRAAAATSVMMVAGAMPVPEELVEFTMNRPFVVVIADENTGLAAFAGVIANPVEIAAN